MYNVISQPLCWCDYDPDWLLLSWKPSHIHLWVFVILYHFNQFGTHITFLWFQKIPENPKNQEKIKSTIKKTDCYVLLPNWLKWYSSPRAQELGPRMLLFHHWSQYSIACSFHPEWQKWAPVGPHAVHSSNLVWVSWWWYWSYRSLQGPASRVVESSFGHHNGFQ